MIPRSKTDSILIACELSGLTSSIDCGGPDYAIVLVLGPMTIANIEASERVPQFTEKPWLKFRGHPTNHKRHK